MKCKWAFLRLGHIAGYTLIGLALFANLLGIDANADWGMGRIAMLALGALTLLVSTFYFQILLIKQKIEQNLGGKILANIATSITMLFVIVVYVGIFTVGKFTEWRRTPNYYDLLANAFRNGQLYLEVKPDPALLALTDPYEPAARSGINWILDATLYHGKYYLYFGPTPSLVAAIIKLFFPVKIEDGTILFAFITGAFIFQVLIARRARNRFFNDLPGWILQLCILVIGIASPFSIMLLTPGIYQAAIASGQFFLIGGIYFAFNAIDRPAPSNIFLILAGAFWAFAIGSRSTLAISIGFLVIMVVTRLIKICYTEIISKLAKALIALGSPLLAGGLALGLYNQARFGSILEFGFLYALTTNNLQKIKGELFLPAYIIQNLYNYLLNPFGIIPIFPVLKILDGRTTSVVSFITLPKPYFAEGISGLLLIFPFTLFAIISTIALIRNANRIATEEMERPDVFNWILLTLSGSFLFGFMPLLMFFWTAFRYISDFYPALVLVSIIGFWEGYRVLKRKRLILGVYIFSATTLAIASILLSLLATISNGHGHIKAVNPEMLQWLKDAFWTLGIRPK